MSQDNKKQKDSRVATSDKPQKTLTKSSSSSGVSPRRPLLRSFSKNTVNYKDVRTLPVSSSKERISQYYNVDSTNGKQGVRFQSHSLRASPKARGSLEDVFPGLDIKKSSPENSPIRKTQSLRPRRNTPNPTMSHEIFQMDDEPLPMPNPEPKRKDSRAKKPEPMTDSSSGSSSMSPPTSPSKTSPTSPSKTSPSKSQPISITSRSSADATSSSYSRTKTPLSIPSMPSTIARSPPSKPAPVQKINSKEKLKNLPEVGSPPKRGFAFTSMLKFSPMSSSAPTRTQSASGGLTYHSQTSSRDKESLMKSAEVLTGGNTSPPGSGIKSNENKTLEAEFRDVLHNDKLLRLFEDFVKQDLSVEALLFWKDAERYRKREESGYYDDAHKIFKKYFGLDAEYPINIDSDIRSDIENKLTQPDKNTFKEAQDWIFDLMKNNSFRKFRQTSTYINFIEDQEVELDKDDDECKRDELNMIEIWSGEDPNPCELSISLLTHILSLFKKYLETISPSESTNWKPHIDNIRTDPEYKKFVSQTSKLQKAQLDYLSHKEKLCFFLNIFNTLNLHATVEFEIPSTFTQKLNVFRRAKYRIGKYSYSLHEIEHAVLRHSMTKPNDLGMRSKLPKIAKQDPRHAYVIRQAEPWISFALSYGTKSSPPINVYRVQNVLPSLMQNAKEYLAKDVELQGFDDYNSKKIIKLPKVLSWYLKDFAHNSGSEKELLSTILPCLPSHIQDKVNFFTSSLKVKYKDPSWVFGGYMGSKSFDSIEVLSTSKSVELSEKK